MDLNKVKCYSRGARNLVDRESFKQSQYSIIITKVYIRFRKQHRKRKEELWRKSKYQKNTLRGSSVRLRIWKEGIPYSILTIGKVLKI